MILPLLGERAGVRASSFKGEERASDSSWFRGGATACLGIQKKKKQIFLT
jgi:hypothetical protein